jgi:hypothetical protein
MHWLFWLAVYMLLGYLLHKRSPFVRNAVSNYVIAGIFIGHTYTLGQWGWVAVFMLLVAINARFDWHKPYRFGDARR